MNYKVDFALFLLCTGMSQAINLENIEKNCLGLSQNWSLSGPYNTVFCDEI